MMIPHYIKKTDIILKPRKKDGNKSDYGRVKIIAGSFTMPGAAALSAMSAAETLSQANTSMRVDAANANALSALKAGAGLVTLAVPKSMAAPFQAKALEATLFFLEEKDGGVIFDKGQADALIKDTAVIAIGMGMGKNYSEIIKFIGYFLRIDITLLIDADGLNALCGSLNILSSPDRKARVILTPHAAEFSRLTGNPDIEAINADKARLAAEFALKHNIVLLLKGSETVITDGTEIFINTSGTPALSKGGSGDVLSGLTAGLAANYPPLTAACYGAYFLGKAAESAEKEYGENSVLASDLIRHIKIRR